MKKILFLSLMSAALMVGLFAPTSAHAQKIMFQFSDSGSYVKMKVWPSSGALTKFTTYPIPKQNFRAIDDETGTTPNIYIKDNNANQFTLQYGVDSIITGTSTNFPSAKAAAAWINNIAQPGFPCKNIPGTTATLIKTGQGTLFSLVVTFPGSAVSYINLWDGVDSTTGTLIGKFQTSTFGKLEMPVGGIKFTKGLYGKAGAVGSPGQETIVYYFVEPEMDCNFGRMYY